MKKILLVALVAMLGMQPADYLYPINGSIRTVIYGNVFLGFIMYFCQK